MGIVGLININIMCSIFKGNSERKVKWEIFFFQVTGLNCGSSGVLWFLVITPDVERNICQLYGTVMVSVWETDCVQGGHGCG